MNGATNAKTPKLVPGKPGTANADRFFIATFGNDGVFDAALKDHGAIEAGSRGDAHLWVLPSGIDLEVAQAIHEAVTTGPGAAEEPPTVQAPLSPEAVTDAVAETAPASPEGPSVGSRDEEAAKDEGRENGAGKEQAADVSIEGGDKVSGVDAATRTHAARHADPGDRLDHGYRTGMSVAERDLYRFPLPEGSVSVGDRMMINGIEREIVMLSGPLLASGEMAAGLERRFPGHHVAPDTTFRLAMWAVKPEPLPAPEPAP